MSRRPNVAVALVACLCLVVTSQAFADPDVNEIERVLGLFEKGFLEEDIELLSSCLSDKGYVNLLQRQGDPPTVLVSNKAQMLHSLERRYSINKALSHLINDHLAVWVDCDVVDLLVLDEKNDE